MVLGPPTDEVDDDQEETGDDSASGTAGTTFKLAARPSIAASEDEGAV